MRIVDFYSVNDGSTVFSVELAEDRFVDVKFCDSGLAYVMQNEDGSTVHDGAWPYGTYPGFEYDEESVLKLVKDAAKVQSQAVVSDVLRDAASRCTAAAAKNNHSEFEKG